MKRYWWLSLFLFVPLAIAGTTFNGVDKVTQGLLFRFTTGDVLLPIFVNNGKVGIGSSSPASTLEIKGAGTTSATSSLDVRNSAATSRFKVLDDGAADFNAASASTGITLHSSSATNGLSVKSTADNNTATIWNNGASGAGNAALELDVGSGSGLTISSLGYVTHPKNPSVSAFQNATQSALTSGATTTINYDGETYDVTNSYNPAGAPGVFTVPTGGAGKYLIISNITVSGTSGSTNINMCLLGVRKGGTIFSYISRPIYATGVVADRILSGSLVMSLAAADTITFEVTCTTSSGTWQISSDTTVKMSIEKLQ